MNNTEPVTVIFDRTVKPGKEHDYELWYKELIRLSQEQGGHINTQVINESSRYITIQQFDSRESLDAWLESSIRASKLEEMQHFVEKAPKPTSLSGIEPWFRLPSDTVAQAKPRRWKQMIVTFCVIYTLVLILSLTVMPYIAEWPVLIRSAVFPAFIVPMMIYVIMPRVTKLVHKWLMR